MDMCVLACAWLCVCVQYLLARLSYTGVKVN